MAPPAPNTRIFSGMMLPFLIFTRRIYANTTQREYRCRKIIILLFFPENHVKISENIIYFQKNSNYIINGT